MPTIELITTIEAPIEVCFDLSRSIDLHKISTSKTNEIAIAGTTSGLIGAGEFVTWRATHFGIRQNLTTTITAFDRPFYFRDKLTNGAFRSFCHDHIFYEHNGKVVMKDVFVFQSPLGILGRLFNLLVLTNYMRRLLVKRNETIKHFAETDKWKDVLPQRQT